MLHATANETVMGRVVCPRRIDPFAAELQLQSACLAAAGPFPRRQIDHARLNLRGHSS